tara:strand:- start:2271 stop:3401 length:1131 start_codon:yes stop_codon:yes gene_type:complete
MKEKLLPLTSMRFLAALFVLLSHLSFLKDNSSYSLFFVEDGFIGVTFFFILSGFILAYSYSEKFIRDEVSKRKYFIARIARIYPLHLLTFIIALPLVFLGGVDTIIQALPNPILLHSWVPIKNVYFSANSPSWSISTELFFYLLFPFLILLRTRVLLLTFIALISFQIGGLSMIHDETIEHALFYISPFFRVSDFILGILLYKAYKSQPELSISKINKIQVASVSSLLVFIIFAYYFSIGIEYKYSLFYIAPMGFVILSFAYSGGLLGSLLSNKVLVFLGESSFALYLVHQLIIRYSLGLNKKFELLSDGAMLFFILFFSLSLSVLLFKYFETPARKFVVRLLSEKRKNTSHHMPFWFVPKWTAGEDSPNKQINKD